ncbi:MAG: hypothetical protein HZB51_29565 [Chloroflexi bacterium]|nr:hypothetical protein [Chloroflexota bacterium]
MKIKTLTLILCFVIAILVAACANPTPITVRETVVAPQTVIVPQTVAVPQTVVVQVTVAPLPTHAPEPTKTFDLTAIQASWKLSAHSNDYGEGRGPNTYCARCHSPRNWDPKAVPGPAPNCMACKFPFDKEVRKPPANTNTFIEQKDWKNIGCDICHQVDAKGVVDPKPAVWNQATGKYDRIASNNELCEKCHTDSLGGSMHKMNLGGNAHTNQIGLSKDRPDLCTDCHNPHSTEASCVKCHSSLTKIAGHDAAHAKVSCQACHDATSLPSIKAGPKDAKAPKGEWITFRLASSGAGGPPSYSAFVSHNLKRAVDCTRCHYPNNAEGLRSLVTPTVTRPPATPGTPAAGGPPAAVTTPTATPAK